MFLDVVPAVNSTHWGVNPFFSNIPEAYEAQGQICGRNLKLFGCLHCDLYHALQFIFNSLNVTCSEKFPKFYNKFAFAITKSYLLFEILFAKTFLGSPYVKSSASTFP